MHKTHTHTHIYRYIYYKKFQNIFYGLSQIRFIPYQPINSFSCVNLIVTKHACTVCIRRCQVSKQPRVQLFLRSSWLSLQAQRGRAIDFSFIVPIFLIFPSSANKRLENFIILLFIIHHTCRQNIISHSHSLYNCSKLNTNLIYIYKLN